MRKSGVAIFEETTKQNETKKTGVFVFFVQYIYIYIYILGCFLLPC